eukprot:gene7653-8493_t
MAATGIKPAVSSEKPTSRNCLSQIEFNGQRSQVTNKRSYCELSYGDGWTVESFVYFYFLVSIGFIMAIMYFISPTIKSDNQLHHEVNMEVFCSLCIILSIVWMSYCLCRQQTPSVVQFTDFPKRYCRPLLVCVYLFGLTCIVTDAITIWILLGCLKMQYIKFILSFLKLFFTISLVIFLKKYSTAVLYNVKVQLFHVIGTCICLMLRTALGRSRPLLPKSFWIASTECMDGFINPALTDDEQYIIAFDQELYVTVIVMLLIIWTNSKANPITQANKKPLHFIYQADQPNIESLNSSTQSELSKELSSSEILSEAVQKEPNVDMGLVFGLTIGGILSIPYTFCDSAAIYLAFLLRLVLVVFCFSIGYCDAKK